MLQDMEWAIKTAHVYPEIIDGIDNLKDKKVMSVIDPIPMLNLWS